jgi:hypothetical protein
MTEFVCRRTGQEYELGEQLDRNGHAVVHGVVAAGPGSDLALKRYLPATLQTRPDLEARIKAMIARPPAYRPDRSTPVVCAWPEDAAYIDGEFVGFVMPRVDVRAAATVPDVATRPATSWGDRVAVAENLARAVALLHDTDVVIGDFREWNVLAWSDCRVTLLGCDRMQVVDPESKRRFPCVAGRDACTPPELQLPASLSSTLRTSSSDIFTLALHLHLLLLHGAHPFRGQWSGPGDVPPEHVLAQRGLWAYAGDPRLAPFPGAAPLTGLPETLQQYFRAAFVDGARRPEARPSAHQWLAELARLRESVATRAPGPGHAPPLPPVPAAPVDGAVPRPAHVDVSVAGTGPVAAALSNTGGPPRTRRLEATRPARHRSALRLTAWAATAVVGNGAVAAVGTVTRRPAPPAADPAVSVQARTTSTPLPPPRPDDPTEALEQMRLQDAPVVEALAESWVAQLSTRPAPTQAADRAARDAAILAGHDTLRKQYPGAVLLRSTDWNYEGRFWITVMNERFPTAEDANAWCETHRFATHDCFAKKLSHSGVVEGSARYRR